MRAGWVPMPAAATEVREQDELDKLDPAVVPVVSLEARVIPHCTLCSSALPWRLSGRL